MEHNVPALPQQEGHNPHMAYDELAECNDNTKRVIMLHQHQVLVQEENKKEVWFYCKSSQSATITPEGDLAASGE